MTTPLIGMCFGTFDRLPHLRECLASIRRAAGDLAPRTRCYLADGGSTDGTLEYLRSQPDVTLIEQGELLGATRAFCAAYRRAIDDHCEYVGTFNDDIMFDGHGHPELVRAVALLEADESLGAVAFTSDRFRTPPEVNNDPYEVAFLPGGKPITFRIEQHHGRAYMNQGLARRAAHMAVARAQGDPTGRDYWDQRYHTYGADSASGCWMWRLGWRIHEAHDLRVHEHIPSFIDIFDEPGEVDPLRDRNNLKAAEDGARFVREWGDPARLEYSREDAERYGGRMLCRWCAGRGCFVCDATGLLIHYPAGTGYINCAPAFTSDATTSSDPAAVTCPKCRSTLRVAS